MLAGTTAPVNMRKQNRVAEWAGRKGLPLICLSDNDGGRLPDLLGWRFSGVPFDFSHASCSRPPAARRSPRITAVLGPSFGDAALHAAMGDFVVMKRDASIALSGPPVIQGAIGEDVDADGARRPRRSPHETSGQRAHASSTTEAEAIDADQALPHLHARRGRLPAPVAPPVEPERDPEELRDARPAATRAAATTCARCSQAIVDADSLFQWGERYGRSLITALARIEGSAVGVVASQPMQRAGVLDVPALTQGAARSSSSATRSTCRWCSSRTCPG